MKLEPESPLAETAHEVSKESTAALYFVIIMAVVQLISVAVYTYNAIQDRAVEREEAVLNRQLEVLNYVYTRQDRKYQEIEYSLISLRTALYQISVICQDTTLSEDEKKTRLRELEKQRMQSKIALIQSYAATQIIFGNEFYNRIKNFVIEIEKAELRDIKKNCVHITPEFYKKIYKESEDLERMMIIKMKAYEFKIKTVLEKEETIEI